MGIYLTPPKYIREFSSNDAREAFLIAQKMGKRYEEGEESISSSSVYSVEYSKIVGRFEQGEPKIAEDPKLSTYYALNVLKARFVLGEMAIAQSPYFSCAYCARILKGVKVDVIHLSMLKKGIADQNNYWVKEYCRYMEYLEGRGEKPYWTDEGAAINWF